METEEPGDGLTSLVLEVVIGQGFGFHHMVSFGVGMIDMSPGHAFGDVDW